MLRIKGRARLAATAVAVAAALSACGERDQPGSPPPGPAPTPSPSPSPQPQREPPAAPPIGNPFGMLAMLAGGDQPGPYAEPRRSAGHDEDEPHAAVLELDQPLVELRAPSLLGGAGGLEIRAVGEAIRRLAADEHVTSLVIRLGPDELDMTIAEELRAAMAGFRRAAPMTFAKFTKIPCAVSGRR